MKTRTRIDCMSRPGRLLKKFSIVILYCNQVDHFWIIKKIYVHADTMYEFGPVMDIDID